MEGRSLKRNAYTAGQGGTPVDVAMPPMNQSAPINNIQDPWVTSPQQQSDIAAVPDQVDPAIYQEMETQQQVPSEEEVPTESEQEETQQNVLNKKSDPRENTFAKMRWERDQAQRERDQLMKMVMSQQKPQEPQKVEIDDDLDMDPDALVEGKNLKKVTQQMRAMQQQLNEYQRRSTADIVETKVRAQYPDFSDVVTEENLQILKEMHPDVANTIGNTTDLYNQYATAYKVIKNFGIHKDQSIVRDHMKAIKNAAKPKPLASVNPQQGDSPLSKANAFANGEFTAEMKKKAWQEVLAARKNI